MYKRAEYDELVKSLEASNEGQHDEYLEALKSIDEDSSWFED